MQRLKYTIDGCVQSMMKKLDEMPSNQKQRMEVLGSLMYEYTLYTEYAAEYKKLEEIFDTESKANTPLSRLKQKRNMMNSSK